MAMMTAIGLMSGTSMDGIDLALLKTDGEGVIERGPSHFVPYEPNYRRRIEAGLAEARNISQRNERPGDLAQLETELTRHHADAVHGFRASIGGPSPDVIGFHGQTVLHRPEIGLTVQLGDGGMLARETGIPVVYDMRAADMLNSGQGAPLVPVYHAGLAHALPARFAASFPMVFVNIGGISNITYVSAEGPPIAFDSGPGNALIDQWVERGAGVSYDAGGEIAAGGKIVRSVVEHYLRSPFFRRPGPKSLDRGDFTLQGAEGLMLADGARTLAAIAAEAIVKSTEHLPEPPGLWIVCGGGRKNPHILGDLRRLADANVIVAEDAGLDVFNPSVWVSFSFLCRCVPAMR